MIIESRQNDMIRQARALGSKKARDAQGLHLIEGEKTVFEALHFGQTITHAFMEEGHASCEAELAANGVPVQLVSRGVMESLAQTDTPQWICACVKTPDIRPPAAYPHGLIVALDEIQDPGNFGTILRTADAMGACGVIAGRGCADAFGPKALRSSMGSVYHLPIWSASLPEELEKLAADSFTLLCGHLKGEETLPRLSDRCVLVVGNEGHGASEKVAGLCLKYKLRMYGHAESLNASVAAGIMLYEIAGAMRGNGK